MRMWNVIQLLLSRYYQCPEATPACVFQMDTRLIKDFRPWQSAAAEDIVYHLVDYSMLETKISFPLGFCADSAQGTYEIFHCQTRGTPNPFLPVYIGLDCGDVAHSMKRTSKELRIS